MDFDAAVRATVRAELRPEVLARRPWRCLWMVALVAVDVGLSVLLVRVWMPWYLAIPLALMIGNLRGGMLFFGHEIVHGATVRSRRLQDIVAFPGFMPYLFSPNTWRIWHNRSHHGHTNQPGKDPDNFGTLEEFHKCPPRTRWYAKFAPGGGHWFSFAYLFAFFMLQAQNVIWTKSSRMPGYERLHRGRAALEGILMLAFWIAVAVLAGPRGAVLVVIIPFAIGNFVVLSYVLTNHMLRPLNDATDTLATSLSVRTLRIFDWMHFHFSHHVEHHLFPAVPSFQMPHIRRVLEKHYGDRYLNAPHWRAFRAIFTTPRIYDGPNALIDPYRMRREEIAGIEAGLRAS